MAIQYGGEPYPGLREFIAGQEAAGNGKAGAAPSYAHPVDEWILRTLNSLPVKAVMNRAIDTMISYQFGDELASSISVDQRSFPDLFQILGRCARTLGISLPHAVVRQGDGFNASTAGTDDYAFIIISSDIAQFFAPEEIGFVIGHECGHIASGHMLYHVLGGVVTDGVAAHVPIVGTVLSLTAGAPLRAWSRRSEITADRAGLLCCGDIRVAERALLRLVAGHADINRIDLDDYLQRHRHTADLHGLGRWREIFASHPMIPKRIEALRLFAESDLYRRLIRAPLPAGRTLLSDDELDRRVRIIVRP
jgi:Zn-dependent protease with chaperone function